ncbi:MAG: hypothetical protein DRP58_12525 [Spirochaetes bacterium]|nr:MAG: hypothetical protein DRP58_12525 [Spirochaetota bacterium]
MRTSETLTDLMKDYLKAQVDIHNIAPNKKGYGYNYVDLAMIIDKSKPALLAHNLLIIQTVGEGKEEGISITTRLQHVSGEYLEDTFSLPLTTMKSVNNVQAMGASITYGKRYGLGAILGIATDEDVDGKTLPKKDKEPYDMDRSIKKLEGCKDLKELQIMWGKLFKEFNGTNEDMLELIKWKDKRKQELS